MLPTYLSCYEHKILARIGETTRIDAVFMTQIPFGCPFSAPVSTGCLWPFERFARERQLSLERGDLGRELSVVLTQWPQRADLNMSVSSFQRTTLLDTRAEKETAADGKQPTKMRPQQQTEQHVCQNVPICTNGLKWTLPILGKWIYIERLDSIDLIDSIMLLRCCYRFFFWLVVTCTSSCC